MPEPLLSPTLSDSPSLPDELRTELPRNVHDAVKILPQNQQDLITKLFVELKQGHLFEGFTSAISPSVRRQFAQQLVDLDKSYPDGGLAGYIKNARKLLDDSRRGANPFLGWAPMVPKGDTFRIGSDAWKRAEQLGVRELEHCGFVLVAGGLGERLGYTSIKVWIVAKPKTSYCLVSPSLFLTTFSFLLDRLECQQK